MGLTVKQGDALALIRAKGSAVITWGATWADGTTVWVNYRTAQALENAGYGRIEGYGEEAEFVLGPPA